MSELTRPRPGTPHGRPRAVVGEDSPTLRHEVETQLRRLGYDVWEAVTGEQVLALIAEHHPDVILLDLKIAGRPGFSVLVQIKNQPASATTPVIVLTPGDDVFMVARALDLGAHDYIEKPVQPLDLAARVSAAHRLKVAYDHLAAQANALETLALRDTSTGLDNRNVIESMLFDLSESGDVVSVVLADVDHMAHINDLIGPDLGDIVLAALAGRVRNAIRPHDTVGRWAGEEYIVVLHNVTPEQAAIVGGRILDAVSSHPVSAGEHAVPVTVSIGCATATGAEVQHGLITRASQAVSKARENGGNQVVSL